MAHYMVVLNSRDSGGTPTAWRYATVGYNTSSSATPADTYIDGRLRHAGLLQRHMFGERRLRAQGGRINVSVGAIVLENADGALDAMGSYAFDGFSYELHEIDPVTGNATANSPIRGGVIEQPVFTEEVVTFAVRDAGYALDKPLLTTKYAGTNALPAGIEGTANDIGGQPKPLLVGECFNVVPICVNTSKLIYQLDGVRGFATGYTLSVLDARVALTPGADYTDQADMEANAPAAGTFRAWPAGGCFRINATPALLTCDVLNPADVSGTGNAEIQYVLTKIAALAGITISQVDLERPNNKVGVYVTDERTALQVLGDIMESASAFLTYGYSRTGAFSGLGYWVYQLRRASGPDYVDLPRGPVFPEPLRFGASEIISIEQVRPADEVLGLPVHRVTVKYARNWRVMSSTELAAASAADQAYYAEEYRTATANNAATLTAWPNAGELVVTTLLTDATQAAQLASDLLLMFAYQRRMFTLRVHGSAISNAIGSGSKESFQVGNRVLLDYARFSLSSTYWRLIGQQEDLQADERELTVWG